MTRNEFYTAPDQDVFDEIKAKSIEIWQTYDNTYGYVDEKVNRIKEITNIEDNAWYIVAMFDFDNQMILLNSVNKKTQKVLLEVLKFGGILPDDFSL